MNKLIKRFANEELGNAVVDWTVFGTGAILFFIAVTATMIDALF